MLLQKQLNTFYSIYAQLVQKKEITSGFLQVL
jgi:hypothetical protein